MKRTLFVKRLFIVACMMLALMGLSASAYAGTKISYKTAGKYKAYQGLTYKVYYKNKQVNSLTTRPGLKIEGNYMIPLQQTLVKNGPKLKYSYNKTSKKITLKDKTHTVTVQVGKKAITVNGKTSNMDIALTQVKMNGTVVNYIPAKAVKSAFDYSYTYSDSVKKIWLNETEESKTEDIIVPELTAASFKTLTTTQFIELMGPICQKNYQETGILASVTLAQAINESNWGKSGLAQSANNLFGMKMNVSGNSWAGSAWDGKSYVAIKTTEEVKGKKVVITDKFRKYANINASVWDHSSYLLNAMNGSKKRYEGISQTTSYTKQLSIIQKGGYCTWSSYYTELKNIIVKYNLTKWDVK